MWKDCTDCVEFDDFVSKLNVAHVTDYYLVFFQELIVTYSLRFSICVSLLVLVNLIRNAKKKFIFYIISLMLLKRNTFINQ